MIQIRRGADRGTSELGWLDSRHTFSFADYYDPGHMGFGPLRVINEDRVVPGAGFGKHGHRDMEIISYVLEGALEHKDSIGTGSVIRPGDVQIMSAGTGILHSEFNHSKLDSVHFLQIWIEPDRRGIAPRYEQRSFSDAERRGQLRLVASPDGRDGSLTVYQDVQLRAALLQAGQRVEYDLKPGRKAWLQLALGELQLNGRHLTAGDGAAVEAEQRLTIEARTDRAEFLLFDLP
jgi:redox-sensitive bicupin YhaK (pirin superfamily)